MKAQFVPSRSKRALLEDEKRLVRGNGWAGCPYWLIREEDSAEPVLPERWTDPVREWEAVDKLIRKCQRGIPYAARTDLAPPALVSRSRFVHQVETLTGGKWPYFVNAQFIAHAERCHEQGIWMLLAEGQLLKVQVDQAGRYHLRATVMCIANPKLLENSTSSGVGEGA
jgi:hypothetical protein